METVAEQTFSTSNLKLIFKFQTVMIIECGPIKWQIDDSILPLGSSFGETSVGIYTGSVNQQTLFLDIGTVTDPTRMLELPPVTIPG